MKGTFCFSISPIVIGGLLKPIRDNLDIVSVLLGVVKQMLITPCSENLLPNVTLVLSVGDKSRIYIKFKESWHSMAFPYLVMENEEKQGHLMFQSKTGLALDSITTTQLIALVCGIKEYGFWDFAEHSSNIFGDERIFASSGWDLLKEVILADDGYFRYDDDPDRAEPVRHPRYHLDFFHSNGAGVKIGMREAIGVRNILSIVDSSPCGYLRQ